MLQHRFITTSGDRQLKTSPPSKQKVKVAAWIESSDFKKLKRESGNPKVTIQPNVRFQISQMSNLFVADGKCQISSTGPPTIWPRKCHGADGIQSSEMAVKYMAGLRVSGRCAVVWVAGGPGYLFNNGGGIICEPKGVYAGNLTPSWTCHVHWNIRDRSLCLRLMTGFWLYCTSSRSPQLKHTVIARFQRLVLKNFRRSWLLVF
jgi:hypothetical protein